MYDLPFISPIYVKVVLLFKGVFLSRIITSFCGSGC